MSGPYGVWPEDPNGDMTHILEASVEAYEAAKERHPSGKEAAPPAPVDVVDTVREPLTAADRCDAACSAAALYRVRHDVGGNELDFCHHHYHKLSPRMVAWKVVGENASLYRELYGNRLKGDDHA